MGIEELKRHLINRELQNFLQKEKISVETAQIIANTINGFPVHYRSKVFKTIDKIIELLVKEKGLLSRDNYELFSESIKGSLEEILNQEISEDIFKRSKIYEEGKEICKQGEDGSIMWFIKKGSVNVEIDGKKVDVLKKENLLKKWK